MLENSIYAILSPEGYASILWKDSKRANEAASEMKLTAKDMLDLGIVEKVIDEPEDLKEENLGSVTSRIKNGLTEFIKANLKFDGSALCEARYQRYRKFGA
jgi:acetyl-CoA carboxylase carboxyl transferase subunit beta